VSTVESQPPPIVRATLVAGHISLGERDTTVDFRSLSLVVELGIILAVPRMAWLDLDVAAAVSHSVVNHHPLMTGVSALCQNVVWAFNLD
jgi:hypothetical protein